MIKYKIHRNVCAAITSFEHAPGKQTHIASRQDGEVSNRVLGGDRGHNTMENASGYEGGDISK